MPRIAKKSPAPPRPREREPAVAPMQGLDDSLGFLIAESGRYVKRALYSRLAEQDVRGGSWYFLRVLWMRDGVTQRELSQRLGIMEASVLEMLRAMERDGLVERRRDEEDRRKMRVYLTGQARSIRPALMKISEQVNAMTASELSPAEEALLKILLRKVCATLSADAKTIAASIADERVR